jgi:hypothetical protein
MLKAQYSVIDRLAPSLKATEHSGPDGNPIATQDVGHEEHSPRDLARAVLSLLRDAEISGGGPAPAFLDLATGAAPANDPTAWQKDAAANPWKTRKIEGMGAPVANGGATTAAGGSSTSAADADYAALTRELGVAGVEVLDPSKDHSQGLAGRDPSVNGSPWSPWPGANGPADHAARREETPPKGMSAPVRQGYQEGDKLPVENCWIEFVMLDAAGERSKWRVISKDGTRCCAIWGEPEARRAAEELSRTGRITR